MGDKRKVSGPMVLVASLGNGDGRSKNGSLVGKAAERARSVTGNGDGNGSSRLPALMETAGTVVSVAALVAGFLAKRRAGSNG